MTKVTIYISPSCPYCHLVQDFASKNGLDIEYKNRDEWDLREELMKITWKTQVPFLVDTDRGIQMHESRDIIEYLEEHYI